MRRSRPATAAWLGRSRLSSGSSRIRSWGSRTSRSEEHTSELQSHHDLVCRLLLEKKKHRHVDLRLLIQIDDDVLAHCCLDAVELVLRAVRAGWQGGGNVLALRVGDGVACSLQLRS